MARARLLHLTVQPVVVFDDGENLTPGPEMQALALSPVQVQELIATLPEQLARLTESLPADPEQPAE